MTRRWHYLLLGLVTTTGTAQAQLAPNLTYDGRVTMARLKYTPVATPDGCQGSASPAGPGWGHDYPMSVQGLLTAINELTSVNNAVTDSNLVLAIDDPELMKHPVLMLAEPGCWDPTEVEAKALRTYLLKGGFLIVDDPTFFGPCSPENCQLSIERFEVWMKRVLPEGQIVHLAASDPIFDGFFKVDPANVPSPVALPVEVVGIYQDNDPSKRLLVVGNYRVSLGHRWRYVNNNVGSGLEEGGAAYKLGLNYLIYGLSH